jgi:hypothetical protein
MEAEAPWVYTHGATPSPRFHQFISYTLLLTPLPFLGTATAAAARAQTTPSPSDPTAFSGFTCQPFALLGVLPLFFLTCFTTGC